MNQESALTNSASNEATLRRELRLLLLTELSQTPIFSQVDVIHLLSSLDHITAVADELSPEAIQLAEELLWRACNVTSEGRPKTYSGSEGYPDEAFIPLTVRVSSNLVGAVASPHLISMLGLNRGLMHNTVNRLVRNLDTALQEQLHPTVLGEYRLQQNSTLVTASAHKLSQDDSDEVQHVTGSKVQLPSDMRSIIQNSYVWASGSTSRAGSYVSAAPGSTLTNKSEHCYMSHVMLFKQNPYIHTISQTTKHQIDTELMSVSLYSCDGKLMPVSDLHLLPKPQDFRMILSRKNSQNNSSQKFVLRKDQANLHRFNISKDTSERALFIRIKLLPSASGKRHFPIALYIRTDREPLLDTDQPSHTYSIKQTNIQLYFPQSSFNSSDILHLAIVDSELNVGRPRKSEARSREYEVQSWWSACVYVDAAKTMTDWSQAGCNALSSGSDGAAHCSCSHLTVFGGSFLPAVNTIVIKDINAFFDIAHNWVALALLLSIWFAYFLLLILCRRRDKRDQLKARAIWLPDNCSKDLFRYEIALETGARRGAGSSATISVVLHGDQGSSETRELCAATRDNLVFSRGARDTFMLTLPDSLGAIKRIQLWHNNAGPHPAWFLSKVIVTDCSTGEKYYFLCDKWFAVDRSDGKVERELNVLEQGTLTLRQLLYCKGTQYLPDLHVWLSVGLRPPQCRFTRQQRLTVCLTLALLYTALNAMWFQTQYTEYRGEAILLGLTSQALFVGLLCCLCVLPVYFLLSLLFRRAKVPRPGDDDSVVHYKSGKLGRRGSQRSSNSWPPNEQRLQHVVTQSILEQSVQQMHSLQEWAQRRWERRTGGVAGTSTVGLVSSGSVASDTTPGKLLTTDTSAAPTQSNSVKGSLTMTESGFEDWQQSEVPSSGDVAGIPPGPPPGIPAYVWPNGSPPPTPPSARPHSAVLRPPSSPTVTEAPSVVQQPRCQLPSCCRPLAWSLCLIISLGCSILTVFYGFSFGYNKSLLWLESLYFSVLMCIFIVHPVWILMFTIISTLRLRDDPSALDHHTDGYFGDGLPLPLVKPKQTYERLSFYGDVSDLAQGIQARQRSRYLRFARPPPERELVAARRRALRERAVYSALGSAVGWLILVLLMGIVISVRWPEHMNRHNAALNIALKGNGNYSLDDVKGVDDWWNWLEGPLFDALYPSNTSYSPYSESLLSTGQSHVIGRVLLRQFRVEEVICKSRYEEITTTCRPAYKSSRQPKHQEFGNADANGTRFIYASDEEFKKLNGYWGRFSSYSGAGWTQELPSTADQARNVIDDLKKRRWTDAQTRAVSIELAIYNPAHDLYAGARLLTELPASTGAWPLPDVRSSYIVRWESAWGRVMLACELTLVLFLFIRLQNQMASLLWHGPRACWARRSLRAALRIAAAVSGLVWMVCAIRRLVLSAQALENTRQTYLERYIDLQLLLDWDEAARVSLSLWLLFILCEAAAVLAHLHRTINPQRSGMFIDTSQLLGLGAFTLLLVVAHASLSSLLFTSNSERTSTWWNAIPAVTSLMLTAKGWKELDAGSYSVWAQVYVAFFSISVTAVIVSLVIAMLVSHRRETKHKDSPSKKRPQSHKRVRSDAPATKAEESDVKPKEMLNLMKRDVKLLFGLNVTDDKAKKDELLPPEFMMAEIEYQVDEMLFRMNALAGSSLLPDKQIHYGTDYTDDLSSEPGVGGVGSSTCGSMIGPGRRFYESSEAETCSQTCDESVSCAGVSDVKIERIEQALFSHEPRLAALLSRDERTTAANSKQLKSQLEMEVFRRLQKQRCDMTDSCESEQSPPPSHWSKASPASEEYSPQVLASASLSSPGSQSPDLRDGGQSKRLCDAQVEVHNNQPNVVDSRSVVLEEDSSTGSITKHTGGLYNDRPKSTQSSQVAGDESVLLRALSELKASNDDRPWTSPPAPSARGTALSTATVGPRSRHDTSSKPPPAPRPTSTNPKTSQSVTHSGGKKRTKEVQKRHLTPVERAEVEKTSSSPTKSIDRKKTTKAWS